MKQSERRARTREQILDAAEQLFSEHGVDGTKIDDIVAAADLARGTFYYNFKTKDELVVGLAKRDLRKLAVRTLKRLETDESAIDVLRELFAGACRWYSRNQHLAETMLTYPYRNPDAVQRPVEDNSSFRHVTQQIIEHAQKRGELREDISAAMLTQIVVGIFNQAAFVWVHFPKLAKLDVWIDQFLNVYLNGARRQPSEGS